MITNFKIFEKIETFILKGKKVNIELSYNKINNIDYVKSFDLSYHELVNSGIWKHITNSQRRLVIGQTYTFLYNRRDGINDDEVKKCINQYVLCFDDKAGPFGGKPAITEGKLYEMYDYSTKTQKIKIKNDNDKFAHISADRFCKSDYNLDILKYNL